MYEEATLGTLLTTRKQFYDKKKFIEDGELKTLNKMLSEIDSQIVRRMQDEGMSQARDSLNTATFYLNEDVVPQIEDWNIFYKYIKENDYFHILHKRVSVKAYRELIENGEEVHGTTPKQLTTLRMRSNNS